MNTTTKYVAVALSVAALGAATACSTSNDSTPAAAPATATVAPVVDGQALISKEEISALFDRWNAALATGDPQKVADEYAPDGLLLPTLDNEVRNTRQEIVDYFANDFLPKKPQGKIVESYPVAWDADTVGNSGIYDFTLTDDKGQTSVVGARFTFVYEKIDGVWKIETQHSSALPLPR